MAQEPVFDLKVAHAYFSAHCFNSTWDLLDKKERSAAEDQDMILRSMASLWHWTQRPDATNTNRSVGYWQVSRVYAVLGRADEARRYGELSLHEARGPKWSPSFTPMRTKRWPGPSPWPETASLATST